MIIDEDEINCLLKNIIIKYYMDIMERLTTWPFIHAWRLGMVI